MDPSLPVFFHNLASQNNLSMARVCLESEPNIINTHTPEPYAQSFNIPDAVHDACGNTWTSTAPWVESGHADQQDGPIPPNPMIFDSTMELCPQYLPSTEWLMPYNSDSQNGGPLMTDIGVLENNQHQQYLLNYERMQSPVFDSVLDSARTPISFMNESNITVSPLRAADYSKNGGTERETLSSNIQRAQQEKTKSLHCSRPKHAHAKRMNLSGNSQCPICDQTFKRQDNIKPHVKRKHRHQFETVYAASRPISVQQNPALTTNQLFVQTDSSAAHDVEQGETPSTTSLLPVDQGGCTNGLFECDSSGPGGSTVPQKRLIDSGTTKNGSVWGGSERQSVPRLSPDFSNPSRSLACPFQKCDPVRYQKCLAVSLQRIKDVKQHLCRCHAQPTYYCASCYEVFDTSNDRDKHSRRRECMKMDKPSSPQFEGITEEQRRQLNEKSPRDLDIEEQWKYIWDVVFPHTTPPRSVYLGNCLEELVPSLRQRWDCQRSGIMAYAEEVSTEPLAYFLDHAMEMFFESLEGETFGYGMIDGYTPTMAN